MYNNSMKKNIIMVMAVLLVVGIGILGEYVPRVEIPQKEKEVTKIEEQLGIANPASQMCGEYGYITETEKDEMGNETGYCVFPDGTKCEEWGFFRNECGDAWKRKGSETMPEEKYKGCPEWVNCMPGMDLPPNHCLVPPQCEGYTQRAY